MSGIRTIILITSLILGGCASTPPNFNPKDPLERLNRNIYVFNDTVDRAVLKPVAKGYKAVIPRPARRMAHNFFSNIDDIFTTGNDLLQLKLRLAASDFTRVWVNSTFGVLGLFDVAYKLEKHNEDFGQTLGYWGVGSGPYLVLPFLGPSSVRDGAGLYVESYNGLIENIEDIRTRNSLYVTDKIDERAQLLDSEKILDDTVLDRYSFIRDGYLMRRRSLVYDGDPPREKYEDEE